MPLGLLGVGSVCCLGPDLVGIHTISLAARYRTAACSNTLNQGLDFAPVLAVSPFWENDFLTPSMSRNTLDAFNIVCHLDHDGKLDEVSQDKKQKVATGLIRDEQHTQDLLDQSPYGRPKCWDRSAVIELRTSCPT